MATDEKLKWLELRINSSLRPRNEDLKNMIAQDDNRLAFHAFLNNEDIKHLYVFMREDRQIEATLKPPVKLYSKCVFFMKSKIGAKLTKENMDSEIIYMDCSNLPLEHLELTIREVFLPLLATNAQTSGGDIMDILHHLMATVEVCQGLVEGSVVLSLPSIEVLAEAAASPVRRVSVLHVLETTVIGWMKQIRSALRHNVQSELHNKFGKEACPLDEIQMWEKHLAQLQSINDQLDSAVAKDILQNLENANSQYAHSFRKVRKEITKAQSETSRVLKFLSTLEPWYNQLHTSENPRNAIKLFRPLLCVVQLIWTHSPYYHQIDKFHHLLRLLSNEVVHKARAMVGDDVLREPLESHSKLKEALRMCAAFRGAYLDFKEKADDQNAKNISENAEKLAPRPQSILFPPEVSGPYVYKPQYSIRREDGQSNLAVNDDLWTDSPWPARNAPCFDLLNNFVERCNDVLELIETTRHFRILASVAEGGVGDSCFDAMVNELHTKFTAAMSDFFLQVKNVLCINRTKTFELAFFNLRTTIKSLEKALSDILRFAFEDCPVIHSQLRLLEVFEGISGRDLVQDCLGDVGKALVNNFNVELQQVKDIFQSQCISPPCHYNMPLSVSKLMWVHGLKERLRIPMEKMKKVSPQYLEGDGGWQIRNIYADIMQDLEKFEADTISKWKTGIVSELVHKLKQPLLVANEYDEDTDERPMSVHVNLDPRLLCLLKEIHYLSQPPFSINLPEPAREFLRSTDFQDLTVTATRLETIVFKYNAIMRSITTFEQPMFERKLEQIDKLLEQGFQDHTWKMIESSDFIESAMSLVCLDVYQTLDVVQTNFREAVDMTLSWSERTLDVFGARETTRSYSMDELMNMHMQLSDELQAIVVPAGNTIHNLVQQSYEIVQISQASPAWKDYLDYIDAIVLDGLKQTTLTSLKAMVSTMTEQSTKESADHSSAPIVTIKLELAEDKLSFCPPLDQSSSVVSLQEIVQGWLNSYVARGKLVRMFGPKGSYEDFISVDEEVKQLVSKITQAVDDSSHACKRKLLDNFKVYDFLWTKDVNQTFENFLNDIVSPRPPHINGMQRSVSERQSLQPSPVKSDVSSVASRASSAKSDMSVDFSGSAEVSFVSPKVAQEEEKSKIFSLDQFDFEIEIYKTARDKILELEDYYDEGWIRVDLKPIKQVLTTYASKWMWTFTKYLANQVTLMLEDLDRFLTRIEPEIESITGEERDTASFMKMMRLFNEVSAQQNEMDEKFAAMHRTVVLLRKYGQILPEKSQFLFSAAPGRWSSLKTKVAMAKQRLGPRIQEESTSITKDLAAFALRLTFWFEDLKDSKVFQRSCSTNDANRIIESFSDRFLSLENEAQDLVELQELLESSVVNFSLMPIYHQELSNLKSLWHTIRIIKEQHQEWKGQRWQKINTRFFQEETDKQIESLEALPDAVFPWDVYIGMHESIVAIQACLPLIDNLSNPAMRTRHWKQLVRVTSSVVTVDSETLKKMTLREMLNLGLQHHVDDVRAVVQRAVKDLDVENALKNSEEVWLSKVFDLRLHVNNMAAAAPAGRQDKRNESRQGEVSRPFSSGLNRSTRAASRMSERSFHSKNQRNSISSLPSSLLNLEEYPKAVVLLTKTDHVNEELEDHQVKLQAMQSNSAAESFLDEVLKWQKRLQTIEIVLQMWLQVQALWAEMEEVYTNTDVSQSLSHDAKRFAMVDKDFKQLMGATVKNPNVLQCCSRKNILKILENMSRNLQICHKSLMHYLERRREVFPRFFFLSMEDVLHIVCSGSDLSVLNLYINKLLENVGSLLYEEADNKEKYSFVITGISDVLGQNLHFDKALCCEGQIETWLSGLLLQIKATLQSQLAHALKTQQSVKPKTRQIQSAGARRVSVSLEDKDKPDDGIESEKTESKANSVTPNNERSHFESKQISVEKSSKSINNTEQRRSWVLDHIAEIVRLATHIQMTSEIAKALEHFSNGNKKALKESLKMIEELINTTIELMMDLKREDKEMSYQENDKERTISVLREQEYGSELDIPAMRSPFDKGRLNVVRESSHLSDEMKSRMSDEEASTTAPLDALSRILPTPGAGRASSIGIDQTGGQGEFDKLTEEKLRSQRLPLLPSQIHKLRSLLLLLAQVRDLMKRLIAVSKHSSPIESFEWKSQLIYKYDEETKATSVTCMKASFDYGFEYLGSAEREVISPLTDKVFVMIAHAIKAHMGVLCLGPKEDAKSETLCEMSKCLGRPLYMFNCTKTTDYVQLQDNLRGMISSGSWLCFNNISLLSPSCLSILSRLMSAIMDALRVGKSTVHLQSEEVYLSPNGACFGLMNSLVPVMPEDMDKLLIYPSAVCQLPDAILNQFRVVSLTKPDFLLCVEVLLLSQGFTNGHDLAKKVTQLSEVCENMFGANSFASDKASLGSVQSANTYGWNTHSAKRIIRLAGAYLEEAQSEDAAGRDQSETQGLAKERCGQEEKALITAIQNVSLPRMTSRDASLFSTILAGIWPNTEIPVLLRRDDKGQLQLSKQDTLQVSESELRTRSSVSRNSQRSIKDSVNLNTSHVPTVHTIAEQSLPLSEMSAKHIVEDMSEAISQATADLGLLLSPTFQARVLQLSQLSTAHQSILVVGVPGCGKSECIKTFAVAEKKRGKNISVQSVFIKAVEDKELFGHYDENTRAWNDGLFTTLLRKFCLLVERNSTENRESLKILQLDGECNGFQMELLHSILNHNGSVILENNERMKIPDTVRFIWELDRLENMSPSFLATTGVMVMTSTDVGWKLMFMQWLGQRQGPDKGPLTELCNIYLEKVADLINCSHLSLSESGNGPKEKTQEFKRVIPQFFFNMVFTFMNILEVLVNPCNNLSTDQYERYISYSAVWAFGGTLAEEHRLGFSEWWKQQFGSRVIYPSDGTVFDYVVNNETHTFSKWSDLVPSYMGTPNNGIPQDAFVHTVHTEQLLHLLGLLTDAGKSVMLVGGNGCGKTTIINERIHTVCSGEVADVLSLTVSANRFTNASLLFDRLDRLLEWRHGRTYVPRGNKRLLCMVDDINLSQTDSYGYQTACELIREHLDDGGFYSSVDHLWRYVKGVTYVTSVNLQTTANVPALSQRLLRHFAIFGCPYPSATELQTIFSTLLSTHFFTPESSGSSLPTANHHHQGINTDKNRNSVCFIEQSLQAAMVSIVKVTIELFEKMRSMFLPTSQRCHYLFNMRDQGNIFRNICLSLRPGCNKRNLFLLWQHECFWMCGKRMVSEVDFKRFRQAYVTAVKKQFIDDAQISAIIKRCAPLFSNLIKQDGSGVTAGINYACNINISEEDAKTDLYRPAKSCSAIKDLLQEGLNEYNKVNPNIKLVFYKSVIEQVCRLSRLIASPHEVANTVLVAEGCPGRCSTIVKFAASLCGFIVLQITPTVPAMPTEAKLESFKRDIVLGYTRAGAKREKVLLLLHEEELADTDCLVFLTEFITSGTITHLFSQEEQTTIINSIRTEVTQAGLAYTRDVALNYFLRTVHNNFRIVFITYGGSETFQKMCREYPAFVKNVNFIWLPQWTKTQLIEHAMCHLKDVKWMSDVQKENVAHMLASMHLVLRQQDGGERTNGEYGHLNNTSYEVFVERFISLANQKNAEVNKTHEAVTKTLTHIKEENKAAVKLKKQLEHEMIVLEERRAGTIKVLSQIGQDTAISEQQIRTVRKQMEKITNLKKRIPEYQVAHERAVYKVISIVADTKKVVKLMSLVELAELRAMQKPAPEIEDLMAAIIMLLKTPSADLTWQKGAKRQMANLERFVEELSTFDDFQLPEPTLVLVEQILKNPAFDPETMQKNTNNSACGALCQWVWGVVRYHRMMISKVKPLHGKVEKTSQAMDNAHHKMETLESRRQALEIRLSDMAKSFEESSIDKNEQKKKTEHMRKMLDTAAQISRILNGERQRCQQIFDSFDRRQSAISGGCAMAAALATYLGPYHHNFRQEMLTVHWPNCLRERGIPLVIDSVDSLKGCVVDWSFSFLKSGASSVYEVDYMSFVKIEGDDSRQVHSELEENEENVVEASVSVEKNEDELEKRKKEAEGGRPESGADITKGSVPSETTKPEESNQAGTTDENIESRKTPSFAEMTKDKSNKDGTEGRITEETCIDFSELPKIQEESSDHDEDLRSEATTSSAPIFTSAQYRRYMRSLIKVLVGDILLNQWLMKDFGPRQIENAAILCSSWQRPPLMIDPNDEGSLLLRNLNRSITKSKLTSLDMENRFDPHFVASLEKAVNKGRPVLLTNCGSSVDSTISPLLNHYTTVNANKECKVSRMISFYGRHILCHNNFKLHLATRLPKPLFNPTTASSVTLINFGTSHEELAEDLLTRAFARIRPALHQERNRALKNLQLQKDTLYKFSEKVKDHILCSGQELMLRSTKTLQAITNITEAKVILASQLSHTESILDDLDLLKDELYPLARRGSLMYSLMRSLAGLCPAYQFTLKYFLELFDEAIGLDFPAEFRDSKEQSSQNTDSVDGDSETRQWTSSSVQQPADNTKHEDVRNDDKTEDEDEHAEESPKIARSETEESASTAVVQRLVHGSESEELPTIELPSTLQLPTEGVEYTSYPMDKVKQLVDSLTSLVYHKVNMSMFEEDRLIFSTLLLLSMKVDNGEDITTEELSFFLQGNPGLGIQLTLADFDCKASAPQWLSKEKWEDILALSVLPGPMDSICVDFAVYSNQWKEWFESPNPETLRLPVEERQMKDGVANTEKTDETDKSEKQDDVPDTELKLANIGCFNDFHKLLILRMLRPDRVPSALVSYNQRHLNVQDPEEETFNVNEVLADSKKHWGVLVLLPPSLKYSSHSLASRIKLAKSPVEEIIDLAKAVKIPISRAAVVGNVTDTSVEEAIDTADKNNGWAIVESINLATNACIDRLITQLQRIHKSKASLKTEEGIEASRFCIWLTSEAFDSLPPLLVQNLLKVAWNSVLSQTDTTAKVVNDEKSTDIVNSFNTHSPESYLKAAIVSTLQLIPKSMLQSLTEESIQNKRLVFAVAVVHAMLVSRQLFGCVGLVNWYPFGATQLLHAVEVVSSSMLSSRDKTEPSFEDLCNYIPNMIYCLMVSDESDKVYITTLCTNIFKSISKAQQSQISIEGILIPIPTSDVAPTDYADWFDQTADGKIALQALHLNTAVERNVNHCGNTSFFARLNCMFKILNMDAGEVSTMKNRVQVSIAKLRSALDICLEQLPQLLDLGDISDNGKMENDFPFPCSTFSSSERSNVPESIGYALFQECQWMNTLLWCMKQDINDLQRSLIGGPVALPHRLLPQVYCLQEEQVPVSWVHPNCQPCIQSLVPWLEDLNKRYRQLDQLLHCGMVPKIDGHLPKLQDAKGKLKSVWLGGLVNPQALLTAIRQEKAILTGASFADVNFECVVFKNIDEATLEDDGLLATDIILENASWDFETNNLQNSFETGFACLKAVYLKPVVKEAGNKEGGSDQRSRKEEDNLYASTNDEPLPGVCNLPVYMNKSRQVPVFSLPVKCPQPEEKWTFVRAAFILNPGFPDEGNKKSRAYLMMQRMSSSTRSSQEKEEAEDEEEDKEDDPDDNDTYADDSGEESNRSQLSFKQVSPKVSPLPEELRLHRERPMYEHEIQQTPDENDANQHSQPKTDKDNQSEDNLKEEDSSLGIEQMKDK